MEMEAPQSRQSTCLVLFFALCVLALLARTAAAQELSATARVEKQEVFLGDSFVFQVEVNGDDDPEEPDLSGLKDFRVEKVGGQNTSSQSVTIINGRVSRTVRRGFVFSYRLTPQKVGRLVIPAVEVKSDGKVLTTRPVAVQVEEPAETEDFKLRLSLSRKECYVGEPITLTVTWYIGKDVRGFQFNLPVLQDQRFAFHTPEVKVDRGRRYYRVDLGTEEAIAQKGQADLNGTQYATLTFQKILVPRQPGTFTIPPATVACDALVGYRREHDFFDDFFSDDFFGMGRQGVYDRFVTPSNEHTLHVMDLPEEGKPANFAGHVGRYHIEADASPREANVGDPITLTIRVSGPEYLRDVELPPLEDQPGFARNFKIPEEMAAGEVKGKEKVFTQTIRATSANVDSVPPIELPYFDTEKGKYRIARSEPISLTIRETRVVTAKDAEGRDLATPKSQITLRREGIAHNYEDLSVLRSQHHGLGAILTHPFWTAATAVPPAVYLLLLAVTTFVRRANADPEGRRARRAYPELRKALKKPLTDDHPAQAARAVLSALQDYLGNKLRLRSGAITYGDVEETLKERGVTDDTCEALRSLFAKCEAAHYAGGRAENDAESLRLKALETARAVEKGLK